MPLLDIQRRLSEVGRLRSGVRDGRNPKKLTTWRATSMSQDAIEAVAALYGGEVTRWRDKDSDPLQWEVVTTSDTLDIVVAPGQVLSAWYELWSGGGCQRRCDGITEMLSDSDCMCPADFEERRALAQQGKACKPTTRFSCLLRDVPVLGLWRAESKGFYAATELTGMADLLEYATRRGMYIPAKLRLDQRTSKKIVNGKPMTFRYAVPVVEVGASFNQISEALGGIGPSNSLQSGQPAGATAALPVASPGPSPAALPAGERGSAAGVGEVVGRAPLPSSPRGRQPKAALPADRPPLPPDPSFKIEVSSDDPFPDPSDRPLKLVPPAPPSDPFDALPDEGRSPEQAKRGQQLAQAAKRADIDDETRHALIEWVSGGRTSSGAAVTDDEAGKLHLVFSEIKRGKRTISFDEDGKVVGVE